MSEAKTSVLVFISELSGFYLKQIGPRWFVELD